MSLLTQFQKIYKRKDEIHARTIGMSEGGSTRVYIATIVGVFVRSF